MDEGFEGPFFYCGDRRWIQGLLPAFSLQFDAVEFHVQVFLGNGGAVDGHEGFFAHVLRRWIQPKENLVDGDGLYQEAPAGVHVGGGAIGLDGGILLAELDAQVRHAAHDLDVGCALVEHRFVRGQSLAPLPLCEVLVGLGLGVLLLLAEEDHLPVLLITYGFHRIKPCGLPRWVKGRRQA